MLAPVSVSTTLFFVCLQPVKMLPSAPLRLGFKVQVRIEFRLGLWIG